MARFNIGLCVLLFVVGAAVGCKPPVEADISPDGRTVALAETRGLVLHDALGGRPDKVIPLKEVQSPLFSPDGKWLALWQPKKSSLYEMASGKQVTLPRISPPFAWKPDGTELVGFRKSAAIVIQLPSNSIVRTYKLPEEPTHACWIGNERDMAFAGNRSIMSVHQGEVAVHRVEGFVHAIGADNVHHKIVWSEGYDRRRPDGTENAEVAIREMDLGAPQQITTLKRANTDEIFGAKGRTNVPTSLSISPDGKTCAMVGVVDHSKPGLMEQLIKISEQAKGHPTPHQNRVQKALESQLRFDSVCMMIPLGGNETSITTLLSQRTVALQSAIRWSNDGHSLAVVLDDKVYVKTMP